MTTKNINTILVEMNPQQNVFEFNGIRFNSCFDSGNLARVTHPEPYKVRLTTNISLIFGFLQMDYLIL